MLFWSIVVTFNGFSLYGILRGLRIRLGGIGVPKSLLSSFLCGIGMEVVTVQQSILMYTSVL
jgi:hypothetical protein